MKKKSPPPRAKRLSPADRRRMLIKAAIETIAKNGVHNATFSAIAEAARVKQPLLNYYFPTFEGLLIECVNMVLEDLKAAMIAEIERHLGSPRLALVAYIASPLQWSKSRPELQPLWLYFYHVCTTSSRFLQLNDEIRRTGRDRITLLIFRTLEREKKALRPPWTADSLAHALQTLSTGYLTMAVTENCDPATLRRELEWQLSSLLSAAFIS